MKAKAGKLLHNIFGGEWAECSHCKANLYKSIGQGIWLHEDTGLVDCSWPIAYKNGDKPWWRRSWFVPWADRQSTRGWTKRGTENMARRRNKIESL